MSTDNSKNSSNREKEVDFRALITRELKRKEQSVTWLAEQEGCPHRNSIYRYLREERDIRSQSLAAMLKALEIHVVGQFSK